MKGPIRPCAETAYHNQDFLGMQSEFVNWMWMLSAPETHIFSVNIPRDVKVGLITKPNEFQSVRVLLQVITEFLSKPCPLLYSDCCQRLENMDLVRMHV